MPLLLEVEGEQRELQDNAYQKAQSHREEVIVIGELEVEGEVQAEEGENQRVDDPPHDERRPFERRCRSGRVGLLRLYLNHSSEVLGL